MTQPQQKVQHESSISIRNEVFSHRMRGLDEDEVREYLDMLADQVQATDDLLAARYAEIQELRQENHRLREESERSSTEISPQAVALFSQAQQVADQLVEEAVIHARDLMMSARHQQRDILERAHRAAEEAVRNTGAPQVQAPPMGYTTPVPEVEYVRTFARVAQVQLRSVLDALTEQVDRLGEVPELDKGSKQPEPQAFPRAHSRDALDGPSTGGGDDPVEARIYEQVWSMKGRAVE